MVTQSALPTRHRMNDHSTKTDELSELEQKPLNCDRSLTAFTRDDIEKDPGPDKHDAHGTESGALKQASPIIIGYLPIGFAYGVLADKAGLSLVNALLMSVIVFAGSAQLIAVGLFASGAAPMSIIATTFVVNLRHLLMSAALAPAMRRWRKREMTLFGFELTDETFAVHSARFAAGDSKKCVSLQINLLAHASWVGGSLLGIIASELISDVRPVGLDYALPAMFIALLVLQCTRPGLVRVAIFSGIVSVALQQLGVTDWNVILATLLGATFGVMGEKTWTRN